MAKDTDRNPDGTFARPDDGSGSDGATERRIEDVDIHGGGEEQAEYIESLDRPGLEEGEAGSKIENLMRAAEQSPEEVPDDLDPSELEAARRALDESGTIEDAAEALEQNLQQSEVEEAKEGRPPERLPFDDLAGELGMDPAEAAETVEVTVKVDGEEETVPLSEMADGYQRQQDYTRKTQRLAEQREEVQQKGEQYLQQLEMLATTVGRNMSPEQQQALAQEYQRVLADVAEKTTPDAESLQEEREQLRESFGWEDESEWNEARQNLRSYAVEDLGFTDQDLARVTDHRLLAMLEKSRRYDEISGSMDGRLEARERKKGSGSRSNTLKPGVDGRTQESVERTRRRRREEGRTGTSKPALKMGSSGDTIEDAAGKIEGILNAEGS